MAIDRPTSKPLQLKRGTARAFRRYNPILLEGQPAFETDTQRLKIGDGYTKYNSLPYIGDHAKGKDGDSAYIIWLKNGNRGTEKDFLKSLEGKSAFDIWKRTAGTPTSTAEDYINYMSTSSWEKF